LNGNLAANRVQHSAIITGISWGVGQNLVLRWNDSSESGEDDGSGVDDFSFTTPVVASTPTASNDTATANAGVAKSINVLSNDILLGSSTFNLTGGVTTTTTANGSTVTVNNNGTTGTIADDSITFTAAASFTGNDTF